MLAIAEKSNERLVILCFVDYYLPGYRSGGPVRTVSNFVDALGDEFDILIVTRDRDLGSTRPYPNVKADEWNRVGKASVFYLASQSLTLRRMFRLLSETPHDILYLNSFFSPLFSGLPLLVRYLGASRKVPCVIAPRGEFSSGAIAIKERKKRFFLAVAKVARFYGSLYWQASSDFEVSDIRREFGKYAKDITIAPDVPQSIQNLDDIPRPRPSRIAGPIRIVFLSRISPKKNLDFLLCALRKVTRSVDFSIFGPVEDREYWSKCELLISQQPKNVEVQYRGEISHNQVHKVLCSYDLFALPTLGENFGHVILESLAAGTPVLISDQTPWQSDDLGGVTTLNIDDPLHWTEEINRWAAFEDSLLLMRRRVAEDIARQTLTNQNIIEANRKLFTRFMYAPLRGKFKRT